MSPKPLVSSSTERPCPLAATLNLVTEKENAHSGYGGIKSVAFSPDGKTIVSCSVERTIKVWELPKTFERSEREVVGSKDDLAALEEAYAGGSTPMLLNGAVVASWEEVLQKLEEIEGEITLKVWDSGT